MVWPWEQGAPPGPVIQQTTPAAARRSQVTWALGGSFLCKLKEHEGARESRFTLPHLEERQEDGLLRPPAKVRSACHSPHGQSYGPPMAKWTEVDQ